MLIDIGYNLSIQFLNSHMEKSSCQVPVLQKGSVLADIRSQLSAITELVNRHGIQ
jgi:hypothetical protein